VIALILALSGPPAVQWAPIWRNVGRVYTSATTHVGIRAAIAVTPDEVDVGLTVQVTARAITL